MRTSGTSEEKGGRAGAQLEMQGKRVNEEVHTMNSAIVMLDDSSVSAVQKRDNKNFEDPCWMCLTNWAEQLHTRSPATCPQRKATSGNVVYEVPRNVQDSQRNRTTARSHKRSSTRDCRLEVAKTSRTGSRLVACCGSARVVG